MAQNDHSFIEEAAIPQSNAAVNPYLVDIPETELHDLHERIAKTRWPASLGGIGWSRGVPVEYLKNIADYWLHHFDWRKQEALLNKYPQYTTSIDGQLIHFYHITSNRPDALPLLLTHGWPSSPVEFLRVIQPLIDPEPSKQAFHLVIPSLPGYGFSTPLLGTGWGNLFRVAQAWTELMNRLGYERYAVHGTDVGSGVASLLGLIAPHRVIGMHMTGTGASMPFGPSIQLEGLAEADRVRAVRFNEFQLDGIGYLHMQATRPQTLAYSLNDSPMGQLAWIIEKFQEWTDPNAILPEHAVDLDQLLTNVCIAWFTGAGSFSAHATYEGMQVYREMSANQAMHDAAPEREKPAGPPTGVAVFAADTTIRSVMDPEGTIQHWMEYDRGGHFPAMEVPQLLVHDLQVFFADIR